MDNQYLKQTLYIKTEQKLKKAEKLKSKKFFVAVGAFYKRVDQTAKTN